MKILEYVKRYKWILVGVLVVVFIAISAVFGVHYYTYRKSTEYAFNTLQGALLSSNMSYLARFVDFRRIGSQLSQETAKVFPFFYEGSHQEDRISNAFQGAFLKLMKAKPDDHGAKEESPEEVLAKPFFVLPQDLIAQLATNMKLEDIDAQTAFITSSFTHPLLPDPFTVKFRLRYGPDGWMLTDLVNTHEIVEHYRKGMENRLQAQHDLKVKNSDKILKDMHDTMEVASCTAHAGLISDRRTLLVIVHITANNKSSLTVKNVNASTRIADASGTMVLFRNLNTTEQTLPGEMLSHRWSIELDSLSDEGRRVLSAATAGPISCSAIWRTMTLSNSRVLHTDPPQRTLPLCKKHHDRHSENFCTQDVFK